MKSMKSLLIILFILLVSSASNNSFAETVPTKEKAAPQAAPEARKQGPKADKPKEQPAEVKGGLCDCLKGASSALADAFQKLEEDEWNVAIKATTDAINTINTIAKTCACPEIIAYQNIAEAYLKYAQGGNHLDGAEEPNCPYATKLYSDAIILLEKYIPQITNPAIKGNAEDIKGYLKEEKEFVDQECNGAQSQEKSKGAGESNKEKKQ